MKKAMALAITGVMAVATLAGATGRRSRSVGAGQAKPDLSVNPAAIAPDFALKDSQGKLIKLSDYKGKVVLVDFWATWCKGCTTEIPWYVQFEKKYGKRGFAVIGVSMDRGWTDVRPFMAREKMDYPVVIGSLALLKQYEGNVLMPATFIVSPDGKIAAFHFGIVNRSEFEAKIRNMLRAGDKTGGD